MIVNYPIIVSHNQ